MSRSTSTPRALGQIEDSLGDLERAGEPTTGASSEPTTPGTRSYPARIPCPTAIASLTRRGSANPAVKSDQSPDLGAPRRNHGWSWQGSCSLTPATSGSSHMTNRERRRDEEVRDRNRRVICVAFFGDAGVSGGRLQGEGRRAPGRERRKTPGKGSRTRPRARARPWSRARRRRATRSRRPAGPPSRRPRMPGGQFKDSVLVRSQREEVLQGPRRLARTSLAIAERADGDLEIAQRVDAHASPGSITVVVSSCSTMTGPVSAAPTPSCSRRYTGVSCQLPSNHARRRPTGAGAPAPRRRRR